MLIIMNLFPLWLMDSRLAGTNLNWKKPQRTICKIIDNFLFLLMIGKLDSIEISEGLRNIVWSQ